MVLKIELLCPIGQKDNLEETPDFESKFFITALIISPITITISRPKSIRSQSHIKVWDFMIF